MENKIRMADGRLGTKPRSVARCHLAYSGEPVTPKERKEFKAVSEALFNWGMAALAAYRADRPSEFAEVLSEAADELEEALARSNKTIRKLLAGGG